MAVIVVASFEQSADAQQAAAALVDGGFLKQEITLRPFDPDTALGDPDMNAEKRTAEPGWEGLLDALHLTSQDAHDEPGIHALRNRECLVMVTSDEDRRADDATRILTQFHPREIVGRTAGNGAVDVMAESVAVSASDSLDEAAGSFAADGDTRCVPRDADGKFAECDDVPEGLRHPANW